MRRRSEMTNPRYYLLALALMVLIVGRLLIALLRHLLG
jgi:hypothetical protein